MNRAPASIFKNPVHFLAFGLGSGASPLAPGTVGTLFALLIYWGLLTKLNLGNYLLLLVLAFFIGIWLCGKTAKDLGTHDHSGIVWDEFVGFWITMFAVPAQIEWLLIGFVLFRLFDICKPWPINWIDNNLSGGIGIMLDDVVAGVYALILLQGMIILL